MQGDVARKRQLLERRGATGFVSTALSPGSLAVAVYRFGRFAGHVRPRALAFPLKALYFVLFYLVQIFTGISVQAYARIGRRFVILNHTCIFVVAESIGDDFTVCEGVTVGNVRGKRQLPTIGSNVFLEPGSKVLGDITLGDNIIVRANSLVLSDVPSNSIALGNPARITPLETQTV